MMTNLTIENVGGETQMPVGAEDMKSAGGVFLAEAWRRPSM